MPDEVKSYVGGKGVAQAEFFHLDAEVNPPMTEIDPQTNEPMMNRSLL